MADKFYRVKEDTFMWDKGAILKHEKNKGGSGAYKEIDDLFNHVHLDTEYISTHIIEDPGNAKFFERVYPVNLLTKTVFKLKEEARALIAKEYNA